MNKKRNRNKRKKEKKLIVTAVGIGILFILLAWNLVKNLETEDEFKTIDLEQGLQITEIESYSGEFWEDGSGETVEDVMMITLYNPTEQDLQYATVTMEYKGNTAEFSATNIPAGESVILLEQNRQKLPEKEYISAAAENIAFFAQPMSIREDVLRITGMNGAMNVENITGEDIMTDIFIYYKKYENDIYNGGITYRVRLAGGLDRGNIAQLTTEHYNPENCRVVDVTGVE